MNLIQVAKALRDAIYTSSDIKTYCDAAFGKVPLVRFGGTGAESPGSLQTPFIAVLPVSEDESEEGEDLEFEVEIHVGISDSTETSATHETLGTVSHEYGGPAKLQCLVEYIYTEIADGITPRLFFRTKRYELWEAFPLFGVRMALAIAYPRMFGDGWEPTVS
ncbi:MAG TPA: hypothetical protein PKL48_03980 [Thermodesulfobacteriota bacterium]|nr:hypothetical protein [Thermodesulfobacteriota bacterium]